MDRQTVAKPPKPASAGADQKRGRSVQQAGAPAPIHSLLKLQRTIGNQAVQRLMRSSGIQAKLTVSQPGDPLEQEADRVADTVMRMKEPQTTEADASQTQEEPRAIPITAPTQNQPGRSAIKPVVYRAPLVVSEDDEEEKAAPKLDTDLAAQDTEKGKSVQAKLEIDTPLPRQAGKDEDEKQEPLEAAPLIHRLTGDEDEETAQAQAGAHSESHIPMDSPISVASSSVSIQRLCADCEDEPVQKKGGPTPPSKVGPSVSPDISALRGGGSPLPPASRAFFEARFGADFSGVRVHTDARTAATATSINAKAFTVGRDMAFGAGQYAPESHEGQRLLAHELTHVVQQDGGQVRRKRTEPQETLNLSSIGSTSIQRQDAPPEHLTSLNEMLDRTNVPEGEVISLLRQLTPTETTTVTTDASYKRRMASAFNIGEMLQAVRILNLKLDKQLEWVEAAATTPSSIDYSDMRSLITTAAQPDRDTLKTARWKGFFVDVCDNSTIIAAVTDLHFDLQTQLEWIEEEASPSNLDYSDIQSLITTASQPDRDILKTNKWRDFFVGVCTNKTILKAVADLHFNLQTQLEWIEEEASPSNLDYSEIQPFIIAAPQPDRDGLKTNKWRDFFIGVCTNATIKDALTDLNFDLLTTIQWMMEEVSVSNIDFTWLCNRFRTLNPFPPGEDTIACAIMERDIRDGSLDSTPDHTPPGWITRAHNQLLVANKWGGWWVTLQLGAHRIQPPARHSKSGQAPPPRARRRRLAL